MDKYSQTNYKTSAPYCGSKSTSPLLTIGGYQGRALAPGDMLAISKLKNVEAECEISLPTHLRPGYSSHWEIDSMVGPYDEGYIVSEDIEMLYNTIWYVLQTAGYGSDSKYYGFRDVSHNATRGGIRLVGPAPKWARKDGGDGGQHPSNVIEYGYPNGTLNWTGERQVNMLNIFLLTRLTLMALSVLASFPWMPLILAASYPLRQS